jgi:hypothetical protein
MNLLFRLRSIERRWLAVACLAVMSALGACSSGEPLVVSPLVASRNCSTDENRIVTGSAALANESECCESEFNEECLEDPFEGVDTTAVTAGDIDMAAPPVDSVLGWNPAETDSTLFYNSATSEGGFWPQTVPLSYGEDLGDGDYIFCTGVAWRTDGRDYDYSSRCFLHLDGVGDLFYDVYGEFTMTVTQRARMAFGLHTTFDYQHDAFTYNFNWIGIR